MATPGGARAATRRRGKGKQARSLSRRYGVPLRPRESQSDSGALLRISIKKRPALPQPIPPVPWPAASVSDREDLHFGRGFAKHNDKRKAAKYCPAGTVFVCRILPRR